MQLGLLLCGWLRTSAEGWKLDIKMGAEWILVTVGDTPLLVDTNWNEEIRSENAGDTQPDADRLSSLKAIVANRRARRSSRTGF